MAVGTQHLQCDVGFERKRVSHLTRQQIVTLSEAKLNENRHKTPCGSSWYRIQDRFHKRQGLCCIYLFFLIFYFFFLIFYFFFRLSKEKKIKKKRHNPRRSSRLRLKCDGTRAETRFCLSAKRTSPFKSAGASVQSTNGSRGVRISGTR